MAKKRLTKAQRLAQEARWWGIPVDVWRAISLEAPPKKKKRKAKPKPKSVRKTGLSGDLAKRGLPLFHGKEYVPRKGYVYHPDGTSNWYWKEYYFLKTPLPPDTAKPEVAEWLERRLPTWRDYFQKHDPGNIVSALGGSYVWHPDTKEYREGHMSQLDVTEPEEIRPEHFIEIVSERYWSEGFLLAGVSLYLYSVPTERKRHPNRRYWSKRSKAYFDGRGKT
jgi:hypothetical protein